MFDPLGIDPPPWPSSERGITLGFAGLSLRTDEIARFGQLYLQHGRWDGTQLLSERWVDEATTRHVSNGDVAAPDDWQQGYGYQFWRSRHDSYRADGAFGQFCIVLPRQDAVIAITSGSVSEKPTMDLIWKYLSPAVTEDTFEKKNEVCSLDRVLRGDIGADEQWEDLPYDEVMFVLERNLLGLRNARIICHRDHVIFIGIDEHGATHEVTCGMGGWVEGSTDLWEFPELSTPRPVAATAFREADGTLVLVWQYPETPFRRVFRVAHREGEVELHAELAPAVRESIPLFGRTVPHW